MVLLIVFKSSLLGPLSFDWDHDIYEACPACVRAHELRTCDGKTKVTFETCQKHRDAADTQAESTALEDAVLKEIRSLVHPLYSPIPTFPVITSTITAKSKEDLRKKVKVTTVTEHQHQHTVVSRRGVHAPATRGNGRDISGKATAREMDQPWPEIKYAHGGGCIYSPEPEVVLKPRAAVAVMDQYAREKLRNITALLDSGITCTLGPQLDVEPDADMDSRFGAGTQGSLRPGPGSSGSTCVAAAAADDESTLSPATLMLRAINAAAAAEARALLVAEKERLEACLATSALAKGLYFKRCNGQCVNALGDVLVGDQVPNGRKAKEEEVTKKDDQSASTCNDASAKAHPALFNSHPQDHLHVGEGVEVEVQVEAETESSTLTRTSTPSVTTPRSATPSLDTSISPTSSPGSPDSPTTTTNSSSSSNDNDNCITTSTTSGTLEDLKPKVPPRRRVDPDPYPSPPPSPPTKFSNNSSYGYGYGYGYGYAVLPNDDSTHGLLKPGTQTASSPTSTSISPFTSPSSTTGTGGSAGPIRFPPPEQPSFTYAMLQAREQLVRSGQVTDENLCSVSWGYNGIISGTQALQG
ncbi:uncharacterized protein Z520_01053 [Fonsecaea multimorphosa CBS 102226]|uniref:Uncharacterized protein n=1 Tax=Fonsecaea multimorphosa CBS 102226 TaxID=1442371 RepID=A0A0D2K927_9EURO|nr:uncharacterized protein Z520_01053 [Fonsecaea multimorphosa CBS 102226]KIY02588.1 hypothetical protein Z520_01053 [Fonsecaea multimorphosa CBS 102226]OAL31454.1 hypothetical protein AYO22_01046 [Fonsecaea multimorphosa]